MEPRLLIYVEEDYLLPVAFDADGRLEKYTKNDDNRLWLYFHSYGQQVEYARKYARNVALGQYGFYGNFFESLVRGQKASIAGQDFPYFDLLRQSSCLRSIASFYKEHTGDRAASVPTSFIFAESVPLEARKIFLSGMETNGFKVKSFSVSISKLLTEYVSSTRSLDFSFSDHVLMIASAAGTIRLSTIVYDGDNFLSDGTCKVIHGVGDAPLKDALVRFVVDTVDRNKGYLTTPEKRSAEYAYQYANVEKWLGIRRNANGDFDIDDFAYSFEPEMCFSCQVSGTLFKSVQEDAVRNTVAAINAYREAVIGPDMRLAVFVGHAFDDDNFVSMMRASLGNPQVVTLTSSRIPEAFKAFGPDYLSSDEPLDKFDALTALQRKDSIAISKWIETASKMRSLLEAFEDELPKIEKHVKSDIDLVDQMQNMRDCALRTSNFAFAKEKLKVYEVPGENTRVSKSVICRLLDDKDEMAPVFESVESIAGARLVIERIEQYAEAAVGFIAAIKAIDDRLAALRGEVVFFESHYDEYLELKKKFQRAKTLVEKREIVEAMESLTMEPLPALKLNPVSVRLHGQIRVEKSGFLGLKKKRYLEYSAVVLNNESLPCNAILDISTDAQIKANTGDSRCIACDFKAGESSLSGEIQLPDGRLNEGSPIYIYLFVAPDVLDKTAIDAPYFIVK